MLKSFRLLVDYCGKLNEKGNRWTQLNRVFVRRFHSWIKPFMFINPSKHFFSSQTSVNKQLFAPLSNLAGKFSFLAPLPRKKSERWLNEWTKITTQNNSFLSAVISPEEWTSEAFNKQKKQPTEKKLSAIKSISVMITFINWWTVHTHLNMFALCQNGICCAM